MKKLIYLIPLLFIPLVSCNNAATYTVNETEFNKAIVNEGKKYLQTNTSIVEINSEGSGYIYNSKGSLAPNVSYYYSENRYQDQEEILNFEECYAEVISDGKYRYTTRDNDEPTFSDWEIGEIGEEESFYSEPKDHGLKGVLNANDVEEVNFKDFTYNKVDKMYHAHYDLTGRFGSKALDCDVQFKNKYVTLVHLTSNGDVYGDSEDTYTFTYDTITPDCPIIE